MFRMGRKDLMRGIISSDYDIKLFIFGYHRNHETIYFLFHFVITQEEKNRCVKCEAYHCNLDHLSNYEFRQLCRRSESHRESN
jgi:hypothetical protein